MKLDDLDALGWAEPFASAFREVSGEGCLPARVISSQRDHHRLACAAGPCTGVLTGRLRHRCAPDELPVVGDWVVARRAAQHGPLQIVECLPRRSALLRKTPDRVSRAQVLAANLDWVFLVTSLDQDLSPRRIERALAMIWEGGAQPVLLLSKADLCADVAALRSQAQAVAPGVDVHALSLLAGEGLEALAAYLQPARTIALIGSSGVGKSTLVNRLLGEERVATGAVRERDGKGRHTTTGRELFALPGGALLIDTPGMRELMLWDSGEGLHTLFDDIEQLAASCRFANCQHGDEPDCALRQALEDGSLEASRYRSYAKLQLERQHLERRRDERSALDHQREQRRENRKLARSLRRNPKQDRWKS